MERNQKVISIKADKKIAFGNAFMSALSNIICAHIRCSLPFHSILFFFTSLLRRFGVRWKSLCLMFSHYYYWV